MKSIPITLGGKKRHLRFDLNALAMLCEKWQVGLEKFDTEFESRLTTGNVPLNLRTVVWASLLHEDADLEEVDVGSWIDTDNLDMVVNALNRLYTDQGSTEKASGKAKAGRAKR